MAHAGRCLELLSCFGPQSENQWRYVRQILNYASKFLVKKQSDEGRKGEEYAENDRAVKQGFF